MRRGRPRGPPPHRVETCAELPLPGVRSAPLQGRRRRRHQGGPTQIQAIRADLRTFVCYAA
eukprot:6391891-Pyramimonas_sp.AAC.1